MSEYVLQMQNISKEYYGNSVLKNVSLNVKKGEIHALLGENGAGKSTLMNILFGMDVIHSTGGFSGEVLVDGVPVKITSPQMAMEYGIGMVHQEFMLIPGFTVTENIKIAREISKPNVFSRFISSELEILDMDTMEKDAQAALDRVGLDVSPRDRIEGMPIGYMQFVEIAREIDKSGVKVLVFDEPTAVLTESEASRLMETLTHFSNMGIAIIFITHRLDEVMEIAHSATVLRDGQLVDCKSISNTSKVNLAEMMIGQALSKYTSVDNVARDFGGELALKLRDFYVDMEGERVKGLDLDVFKGEIIGLGGLAGQGKIGVCNGIMGLYNASGECEIFGESIALNCPGEALNRGVAFVSEDRRGVGILKGVSIADNIAFSAMQVNGEFINKYWFVTQKDNKSIRAHADEMIKEFDIRCTGYKQTVESLSGGNQQKVCLARAITLKPRLLFVAEPTRGIDIGAKKIVLDKLVELNKKDGVTIVVISSELAELRSVCDRIAIVTDGRVASILLPDAPEAEFGLAMGGAKVTEGEVL